MEIPGVSNDTTQTTSTSDWHIGTVTSIRPEAPGLKTFTFTFDEPIQHSAGQHYEIRLTAENGYQAARLYSAAMPANGTGNTLQLTIALMPDGEVSPYLFQNVSVGDQLELRGPLGRYFVWEQSISRPIFLIGGGTGVVPLRAMRLAHQQACMDCPIKLLYSVKSYEAMAYKYELFPVHGLPPEDVFMTFTKSPPPGWKGFTGRIDAAILQELLGCFDEPPIIYVCGPTPMVESVSQLLVSLKADSNDIRTERFGASTG
jgi:ferredoxin-NADP reductase